MQGCVFFIIKTCFFCILLSSFSSLSLYASQPISSENYEKLTSLLRKTKTGKELLEKTKETDLQKKIYWGHHSHTDQRFIRTWNESDSVSSREVNSRIFINQHQSLFWMMVDLAHELTHVAYPSSYQPYDKDLDQEKFIRNGIKGRGGELEAVLNECRVARALKSEFMEHASHCDRYWMARKEKWNRSLLLKDFYRLGKWKKVFLKKVKKEDSFKYLSSESPVLISDANQTPYPLALANEYQVMNQKACMNNQKKIKKARSIASKKLKKWIKKRCEK